MLLEILGWIFVVVLCVAAYYGWKVYRFIKKVSNSDLSLAITVLPPQELDLEPSNREEWSEIEQLSFAERELKKIGARHVGYYCVYSGEATIRLSIWDVQSKAIALIYEAFNEKNPSNVAYFMEVASRIENGSVCISTNPSVSYSVRPENHIAFYEKTSSMVALLKAIKPAVPFGKRLMKISDPLEFFHECNQDIAEFSWRKEQLYSNKTQQILQTVGLEVNEELMNSLIEMGVSFSVDMFTERAKQKLAKHSKMSAEQWEKVRDKIIVIHERMQMEHVVDSIYEVLGELTDNQQRVLDGFQVNAKEMVDAIASFQLLAQMLQLKIKRLSKLDEPVKTEIYIPLN